MQMSVYECQTVTCIACPRCVIKISSLYCPPGQIGNVNTCILFTHCSDNIADFKLLYEEDEP